MWPPCYPPYRVVLPSVLRARLPPPGVWSLLAGPLYNGGQSRRRNPPMQLTMLPESPRSHSGMSRRDFVRVCTLAAAAVGLPGTAAKAFAAAAAKGKRPSVIWLHFQECTGCTESLLRTSHPALAEILLDLISLDYHETLFAAAGKQAEDALDDVVKRQAGKFLCIVEGAVPVKDNGIYCMVGGRTAVDILGR